MKNSEDKLNTSGTIREAGLDIVGEYSIKLKLARVYDWFDQVFWTEGLGDFSNGILEYSIPNLSEKGLYIILCVNTISRKFMLTFRCV